MQFDSHSHCIHSFILFPILVKNIFNNTLYIISKYINNTKKMEEPAAAIGLSKAGLKWPQIIIQSKENRKSGKTSVYRLIKH